MANVYSGNVERLGHDVTPENGVGLARQDPQENVMDNGEGCERESIGEREREFTGNGLKDHTGKQRSIRT